MTAFDLGDVGLIVDRPGATPAPTFGDPDTGPGNGQRPGPSVDSPPTLDDLGLTDDLVAHALHTLSLFGEHTYREAAQLLSMWARYDQLTTAQVAEVLAYYQPALPALRRAA